MRKIHECAEDIKNILNDAERTEEVDGDMLCSINELVDEILSIYCLEKQQRKMDMPSLQSRRSFCDQKYL